MRNAHSASIIMRDQALSVWRGKRDPRQVIPGRRARTVMHEGKSGASGNLPKRLRDSVPLFPLTPALFPRSCTRTLPSVPRRDDDATTSYADAPVSGTPGPASRLARPAPIRIALAAATERATQPRRA